MQIIITPSYSDIFSGEKPSIEELLKDIPSNVIIEILALINAELYIKDDHKTQLKIFDFLTQRQSQDIKRLILSNATKKIQRNRTDPVHFFSTVYNLEFMHYELLNYKVLEFDDTTPEQELSFLKAYFLIVETLNDEYTQSFDDNEKLDADYFYKTTWPTFISQFEINHRINPFSAMIKGLILLNYFNKNPIYNIYVQNFLNSHEKKSLWHYSIDLMNVIKSIWDRHQEGDSSMASFSIRNVNDFKKMFLNFSIDTNDYQHEYQTDKKNFSGLKDKPLFKHNDDNYIVLNWNFLSNKLYEGLVFDFYKNSGIKEHTGFSAFLDFKKFISRDVMEKVLFEQLFQNILSKKKNIPRFDESDGFPDCYFRDGNKLYLIEFKDAYFPAKSIGSYSFEKIKNAIDEKYNSKKKGTGQIIKQLVFLSNNSFEDNQKIPNEKLIVYPVIVHTDVFYSCPGFNRYLADEFRQLIVENELQKRYKEIRELTFLNLSFLIDSVNVINDKRHRLFELIDSYHQYISNKKKEFKKEPSEEKFISMQLPFEKVIYRKYREEFKKETNYVKLIFEIFNLASKDDMI